MQFIWLYPPHTRIVDSIYLFFWITVCSSCQRRAARLRKFRLYYCTTTTHSSAVVCWTSHFSFLFSAWRKISEDFASSHSEHMQNPKLTSFLSDSKLRWCSFVDGDLDDFSGISAYCFDSFSLSFAFYPRLTCVPMGIVGKKMIHLSSRREKSGDLRRKSS